MQSQLFKTINKSCWRALWRFFLFLLLFIIHFCFSLQAQNITRPNISGPSGLQVNSYTGELFFQRTDFFLHGQGLSLDITFSYNSADRAMNWGFGYGWTFTYNRFYVKDSLGNVALYNGDGREDLYQVKEGAFVAPVGVFDKASEYEPGKFRLRTKDGTQYFFDDPAHRKLTKIRDRNDNEVVLSYNGNNISAITDPSGRSFSFVWTSDRLTEIKADFGTPTKSIKYTYDDAGSLISVKDPMGYIQTYSYGRNRLLSGYIDKNGNTNSISYNISNAVTKLVSCTRELMITYNTAQIKTVVTEKNDGGNQVTTYAFDSTGKLTSREGNCCGFKNAFTYDEYNNISSLTDANRNKTIYAYDKRGNLLSEIDALGNTIFYTYDSIFNQITSTKNKNGLVTSYKIDAKGNLTEENRPLNISVKHAYDTKGNKISTTDGRGKATTLAYDQNGYLTSITDPLGGVTQLTYDSWGNLVSRTDQNNNATTFQYDALNRLVSFTDALGGEPQFTYDGNNNITSLKDANGNKTTFLYNAMDKVVLIKDAGGNSIALGYDAVGNLTESTNSLGNTTKYAYDNLSRLVTHTNSTGEQKHFKYDGNGNITTIIYPNGNKVASTYDALNRLLEIRDNIGLFKVYSYDYNSNILTERNGKGETTTYKYDLLNRLVSQVDPLGNSYAFKYDQNNNLIQSTDRNGNSTSYSFDALDRKVSNTDALGFTTVYTYDKVGNLTSIKDANGNISVYTYDVLNRNIQEQYADNTTKTYMYDALNNLIRRKDNNGFVTSYVYNTLNQLVARVYPLSTDSFRYDGAGRLITAKNGNANVEFVYDAADKLIKETLNGKVTHYENNTAAGIKKIKFPSGRIVERAFDFRDQLIRIRENNGLVLSEFTYDASSKLVQKRYANGTVNTISYNSDNSMASLNINPQLINTTYKYNKEGVPIAAESNHLGSRLEQYKYDKLNQLTSFFKDSVQTSIINYDPVGNRTSAQINGKTVVYASSNMNAYSSITQESLINYSYDNNGNLISDGKRMYSYDFENRMISVDNGVKVYYFYDALGRRIKKVTTVDTINYYFDGLQVIEEYNGSNVNEAAYVWGGALDDLISMDRFHTKYYYHANSLGSILNVTDSSGIVIERYDYDPFGNLKIYNRNNSLETSSSIKNTYTYTCRQYEPESQLYYYRARHYDAKQGRFIQRDPLGYYSGDINLYSYVSNMPLQYTDPLGLSKNPQTCRINDYNGPTIRSDNNNNIQCRNGDCREVMQRLANQRASSLLAPVASAPIIVGSGIYAYVVLSPAVMQTATTILLHPKVQDFLNNPKTPEFIGKNLEGLPRNINNLEGLPRNINKVFDFFDGVDSEKIPNPRPGPTPVPIPIVPLPAIPNSSGINIIIPKYNFGPANYIDPYAGQPQFRQRNYY